VLDGIKEANYILDEFQYPLAGLPITDGDSLDKNSFSWEEIRDLDTRLDAIIESLEQLKAPLIETVQRLLK